MTENSLEDQIMSAKPIAMRRCLWLVNEATSLDPKPDMATKFTLRAISNCAHFGQQLQSKQIKERNRLLTEGALKKLKELYYNFDKWHKETENEHPIPLKAIWAELCLKAKSVNDRDALAEWIYAVLSECKMVSVLTTEHSRMKNDTLDWKIRYAEAGICLVTLMQSPLELCKKVNR